MANKDSCHSQSSRPAEWWRGTVIYQIYLRSFQDSNEDGVGDLEGARLRLEYVKGLGADAVWLSPMFPSPMKDFGYDVSDYRDVDPLFGTLDDFDAFLDRAHALDLKVLLDLVLSHTSDQHPWFEESRQDKNNPKSDWYVWADPKPDGCPPNNWLSSFGGVAWEWEPRRRQYYLHNFLVEQPDLNFHNPEVRTAVLDVMRFWFDRGVDGFRLDVVNYYFHDQKLRDNPPSGVSNHELPDVIPYAWQDHVYNISRPENAAFLDGVGELSKPYPGATILGELAAGHRSRELMAEYTKPGRIHMCYSFDFMADRFEPDFFKETIEAYEQALSVGWICWAFSNHDVRRTASRWSRGSGDKAPIACLAMALLCSLRGSICIYQGEELGLPEAELDFEDLVDPSGVAFWPGYAGRDGCRTPMVWEQLASNAGFTGNSRPWLPIPDEHRELSVDRQSRVHGSVLETTRSLLSLRQMHPALKIGSIEVLECDQGLLGLRRQGGGQSIICLFNFLPREMTWMVPRDILLVPLDGDQFGGRRDGSKICLSGYEFCFLRECID